MTCGASKALQLYYSNKQTRETFSVRILNTVLRKVTMIASLRELG